MTGLTGTIHILFLTKFKNTNHFLYHMKIIKASEFEDYKVGVIGKILEGAVFIYPTDTIYGIGCDATNFDAVAKLRLIKGLPGEKPVSVIAPSKQWILDNCVINDNVREYLEKLPGAYTLILKLKNKTIIAKNINFSSDTIGVRIPDHFISQVCAEIGKPIVTTSANIFGQKNMTCLDDMDESMKEKVDFVIDAGKLSGNASTLVYLDGKEVDVKKR